MTKSVWSLGFVCHFGKCFVCFFQNVDLEIVVDSGQVFLKERGMACVVSSFSLTLMQTWEL